MKCRPSRAPQFFNLLQVVVEPPPDQKVPPAGDLVPECEWAVQAVASDAVVELDVRNDEAVGGGGGGKEKEKKKEEGQICSVPSDVRGAAPLPRAAIAG